MDAQLKAQLKETINVAAESSRDNFGDITLGTPSTVSARVEQIEGTITYENGRQEITTIRIFTESEIKKTDRVWLPGDSTGNSNLARRPKTVKKFVDENGNTDYYETLF